LTLTQSHPVLQFGYENWANEGLAKSRTQATNCNPFIPLVVTNVGVEGAVGWKEVL
jgi:hypothetical protein